MFGSCVSLCEIAKSIQNEHRVQCTNWTYRPSSATKVFTVDQNANHTQPYGFSFALFAFINSQFSLLRLICFYSDTVYVPHTHWHWTYMIHLLRLPLKFFMTNLRMSPGFEDAPFDAILIKLLIFEPIAEKFGRFSPPSLTSITSFGGLRRIQFPIWCLTVCRMN